VTQLSDKGGAFFNNEFHRGGTVQVWENRVPTFLKFGEFCFD